MKVSVIIPVYNAEKFILDCLASIVNQTFSPEETEVIIVNDGSIDQTGKILDKFANEKGWRIIHQENQGPAAARTVGLKKARGDYVFILSHDCVAAPDWVESVVSGFEKDKSLGIVQGKILSEGAIRTPIFHCTRLEQFSPHFETAAIAYRAAALDKAGRYFDEELSEFGDDTDLAWRILEAGFTSKWLPKVTALHKVLPQPFFKEVAKAWGCQKFPLLIKKHPGFRKYLRFGIVWGTLWRLVPGGFIFRAFKRTRTWQIPFWQKVFIVIPHSFLTELIGSIALCYGAIRHRVFVI